MKHYRCRAALCCLGLLALSCTDISPEPLVALALPFMTLVVQFEFAARRQEDDWRDRYRAYYRARMAEIRRLFTVREENCGL